MADNHHKTPVQIIATHMRDWIDHSPMTETTFATLVREAHEARYQPHQRTIEWSQAADPVDRMESDRRHVMRWLEKGSNARLPAEIYDVAIMVFPADRRFALEEELAAARGGLFVPVPAGAVSAGAASFGRMAKEVADALGACAELYDDGVLDSSDKTKGEYAQQQIREAIAKLLEMNSEIDVQVYGRKPEDMGYLLRRVK